MDKKGFVLFSESGARLTRDKMWGNDETAGWVWSFQEVANILDESKNWDIKPMYFALAFYGGEQDNVFYMSDSLIEF